MAANQAAVAGGPAATSGGAIRVHGVVAQFDGPGDLLHAAEKVRDAGYKKWDTHSPFPIHGMDIAVGAKRSKLPWFVAVFALMGFAFALWLQWWTSVEAYPLVLSGKPYFSHMAFFPITFGLTVLFSVLATVVGLTLFIRQSFHHPIFYGELIDKASDDGFLISIMADDPKWDREGTQAFLREIGGRNLELLEEK